MKFIPDRIRKIFSKKSRKQEAGATATAPAPVVVEAPAPVAPEPPKVQAAPANRMDELAKFRTPEGNYLLDLNVGIINRHQGQTLQMVKNKETGFQLALASTQYLTSVKSVATHVEDYLQKTYGFDVGHTFYKRKDANFHFDGYDELLGLPPGDGFQILLVPEGSNWTPPFSPPPMYAIPGTGTVLQHPATLLPQFQPQVRYPIMFVNGMDVLTPTLPHIGGVAPRETVKPEEKKPEEKPAADAVAQPAAAPPPPKM